MEYFFFGLLGFLLWIYLYGIAIDYIYPSQELSNWEHVIERGEHFEQVSFFRQAGEGALPGLLMWLLLRTGLGIVTDDILLSMGLNSSAVGNKLGKFGSQRTAKHQALPF